jgi:hypothetical protein
MMMGEGKLPPFSHHHLGEGRGMRAEHEPEVRDVFLPCFVVC